MAATLSLRALNPALAKARGPSSHTSSGRTSGANTWTTPAVPRPCSRQLAVFTTASCCQPGAPLQQASVSRPRTASIVRSPPGASLFDLFFGEPVAADVSKWLSTALELDAPLQPFTATTHADRYELNTDLPGMGPDDVIVEVTPEGLLRLRGERKRVQEVNGEDGSVVRHARTAYSFERSFALPEDAVAEQVAASLDKGVLTVTVPRKEPEPQPQPRRIVVKAAQEAPSTPPPHQQQQQEEGAGDEL